MEKRIVTATYIMLIVETIRPGSDRLEIDSVGPEVPSRDLKRRPFPPKVIMVYFYDIEITEEIDDAGKETKEFSQPKNVSSQMFMPGRGVIWSVEDLMGRRDERSLATLSNLLSHGIQHGFLDTRTRQMFEVNPEEGDRILGEDEVAITGREKVD